MPTRISSKGQVTIPAEIRKQVNLKTGDMVDIKTGEEGTIILYPYLEKHDSISQVEGIIQESAGIWSSLEESGEEFVQRLRSMEDERWKVLGIE